MGFKSAQFFLPIHADPSNFGRGRETRGWRRRRVGGWSLDGKESIRLSLFIFVTGKLNRASTEQDYKHFLWETQSSLVRLSGNKANDGEN